MLQEMIAMKYINYFAHQKMYCLLAYIDLCIQCFQHGETALHLVAKYNHANVITAFAAFKISMDIRGKVHI